MKNRILILSLMGVLSFAGLAGAQDEVVNAAIEACTPEIETYCSQVTPGEGTMLACSLAHEDKLSGTCSWALYEAMEAFEEFVNAVNYVASACYDDMVEHCGDVKMGEGRVATCLLENEAEVSSECKKAMDDVALEVVEE